MREAFNLAKTMLDNYTNQLDYVPMFLIPVLTVEAFHRDKILTGGDVSFVEFSNKSLFLSLEANFKIKAALTQYAVTRDRSSGDYKLMSRRVKAALENIIEHHEKGLGMGVVPPGTE